MTGATTPVEPSTPAPTRVRLQVGETAIAAIAAAAAGAVPGVVALRADLGRTLTGLAGSMVGRAPIAQGVSAVVADDATELEVTIVTRLGSNCRDVAAAVQQAVTTAVVEQTGLATHARVTVAEILLD